MLTAIQCIRGATLACILGATAVEAEWSFNAGEYPNAFIQTGNATLELQCDRVRFAPAGYEDSQDIVAKQGLSFRFMKNGSTEVGAFQAGAVNTSIQMVDNYPVEIALKFMIVNAIWIPIHFAWLWLGITLRRMNLPHRTQRAINVAMALSMLLVVALAATAQS